VAEGICICKVKTGIYPKRCGTSRWCRCPWLPQSHHQVADPL